MKPAVWIALGVGIGITVGAVIGGTKLVPSHPIIGGIGGFFVGTIVAGVATDIIAGDEIRAELARRGR